jgi:hypothetical protein
MILKLEVMRILRLNGATHYDYRKQANAYLETL